MELDELKKELAAARKDGARSYPKALRQQAAEFARGRRAHGATVTSIAAELGVDDSTLAWWLNGGAKRKSAAKLQRVQVVSSGGHPPTRGDLVLEVGQNLRVTGLDVASTAALLRALS